MKLPVLQLSDLDNSIRSLHVWMCLGKPCNNNGLRPRLLWPTSEFRYSARDLQDSATKNCGIVLELGFLSANFDCCGILQISQSWEFIFRHYTDCVLIQSIPQDLLKKMCNKSRWRCVAYECAGSAKSML